MKIFFTFQKKNLLVLFFLFFFKISFCQLSGTKIIGTAPSDYTTFNDAVSDLITYGVNGPVVFDVKAGTYNEQIFIPKINGASSINTITFQSQDSDTASVKLSYSPSGYEDDYTIWLYAANHITFHDLTLSSTGTTYSCVIVIDSLADNNNFLNNRIIGYQAAQASVDQALIYSSGFDENNNIFSVNHFLYGSYGIYYYGTSNKESGTMITDNTFEEQYYSAIYLSNQNAPVISGNDIFSFSTSLFRAIHCQYSDNQMVISKNKINIPLSYGGYGIYITNCESTSGNEALISNNFVRINTEQNTCSGIACLSSSYQKFYFNSVNITGDYNSSCALAFEGYGSDGIQIKNNIFSNRAGGYAIYCFLSTSLFSSDYNDFYSTGTNLCNYYGDVPTLASWVAATSNDTHTKNIDPDFVSDSDLHCSASSFASAAISVADVTDDIDDELRGSTPDIGADEFEFSCISDFSEIQGIKIYPNPASDFLYISFTELQDQEISFIDYCGRVLKSLSSVDGSLVTINLSDIPEGVYLLKIKNNKEESYFPVEKTGN